MPSLNAREGIFCFAQRRGIESCARVRLRLNAREGIFCFALRVLIAIARKTFGLNAREGIFCFAQNRLCSDPSRKRTISLNAREGIFCFAPGWGEREGMLHHLCVSMPARAFFVLHTFIIELGDPSADHSVSMPARAFFVLHLILKDYNLN